MFSRSDHHAVAKAVTTTTAVKIAAALSVVMCASPQRVLERADGLERARVSLGGCRSDFAETVHGVVRVVVAPKQLANKSDGFGEDHA